MRYKVYEQNGSVIVEDTTDGYKVDVNDVNEEGGYSVATLKDNEDLCADIVEVSREATTKYPVGIEKQ